MGSAAPMGAQMGLGFGDAAATDRLFFAAFPDGAAAARIETLARELRREHRLSGRPLPTGRFHVTLLFLGDYPADVWPVVANKAAAAAHLRLPAFRVVFDQVSSFASRRPEAPLVMRGDESEGLRRLHAALNDAMRGAGIAFRAEREFVPHLTLLYDERRLAQAKVEPVSWQVDEWVLVRSPVGKGGYQALARGPLLAGTQLKS